MSIIELIFSIYTILYALIFFIPKFTDLAKSKILPGILGVVTAFFYFIEVFRWQLQPLLIASMLLVLLGFLQNEIKRKKWIAGLALVMPLVSIVVATIFPVPDPYPITGPYQVGTRVIQFIDPDREELYGSEPGEPREFMAQVWYPALPGSEDIQAQWMPDVAYAAPALADKLDLPTFALEHLKLVNANAFLEADPVQDGSAYPVLIFSHGWEGFKEQNIYQVEELASHGYVVIGISHTYGSVITVFPDGRQMAVDQDALPDDVSDEAYDRASNILVKQWAGDISHLIDQLETPNQSFELGFLSHLLDLEQIGVLGHSTGGGAGVEFCLVDQRCQALLGMDIWAEPALPEILEMALTQPALILHSEDWYSPDQPDRNYDLIGTMVEKAENDVVEIALLGTRHYDFTSLPLLTPLAAQLGLKGPIPGTLGLEIINAESVAFFDLYLKGDESINLAEISGKYPESLIVVRP